MAALAPALPAARATDAPADRLALADIYASMGGAQWTTRTNWLAPNPNTSMCTWHGVACEPAPACSHGNATVECRVTQLNLVWNRLTGSLSHSVRALVNLTQLDLGGNAITGTIFDLSPLAQLRVLTLSENQLSGPIPPSIGALVRLEKLLLYGNTLNGTIPSLETLTRLNYLDLEPNHLSGSVPLLANLTQLEHLYMGDNRLEGTVPSFDTLVRLRALNLQNNQLYGSIPSFTALTSLEQLWLHKCSLTGTIPAFESLTKLRLLYLFRNRLHGSIPNFTGLADLDGLLVFQNQLSGTLPHFANLTKLTALWAYSNNLSGSIPDYAWLSSLKSLQLHRNRLIGTIPDFRPPQMYYINLQDNRLNGTVPLLSSLSALESLRLDRNLLHGVIPDIRHPALQQLYLSSNRLVGTLPPLTALTSLTELVLASNSLSGTLPHAWRRLRALSIVDVSDNRIDGDLRWFSADADGALPPLAASSVNVSHNALAGRILALAPSLQLTSLDMSANEFACPFPVFPVEPPIVVFRTPCVDDWDQLATYACIGVGAALVAASVGVALKRAVEARTFRLAVFGAAWTTTAAALFSDAFSYVAIVRYLVSRPRNCEALNTLRLFLPLLRLPREDIPQGLRDRSGPATLFAAWISSPYWRLTGESDQNQQLGLARFGDECAQVPECSFDVVSRACVETRPERALSGGGAHTAFFHAVLAFVAVRAAFELACLVTVLVSLARNAIVRRGRLWMGGSAFAPLLLLRAATRDAFVSETIFVDTPPADYIWLLLTSGVAVSATKLFADLYYLMRVSQTGLAWSNWLRFVLSVDCIHTHDHAPLIAIALCFPKNPNTLGVDYQSHFHRFFVCGVLTSFNLLCAVLRSASPPCRVSSRRPRGRGGSSGSGGTHKSCTFKSDSTRTRRLISMTWRAVPAMSVAVTVPLPVPLPVPVLCTVI